MTDHIVTALAPGVRVAAAITTGLTEEARKRHDCWPVATAALGRTMTAALLLAETLKGGEESLTVRISGNGPLGDIVADSHSRHVVRGYVRNPHVDLPPAGGKLALGATRPSWWHEYVHLVTPGVGPESACHLLQQLMVAVHQDRDTTSPRQIAGVRCLEASTQVSMNRYPTCNSVIRCRGCAGSSSSFWRRLDMCTRT